MKHLESLFDRALDAVVGMDGTGRVIAWNKAAEVMFGYARTEVMGRMMSEVIVPPQHRDAHTAGLAHYNRTGEGPVLEQHIRITAIDRDKAEFPVELSIFAMGEDQGGEAFYAFIRSLVGEQEYRRAQKLRAREADAVMNIGRKLLEDVSLEDFTQYCLAEVCAITELDAAHIFLVRGRGADRHLAPMGVWHLSDPKFEPVVAETARYAFRRGEGLPGAAWAKRKALIAQNLDTDPTFQRREVFAKVGLKKGVAIPVRLRGETQAVLEVFGDADSRLDDEAVRLLKTVGVQLGAAIRKKESAEMRETLRREMVHRVGNSLAVLASIYRACSRQAATKEELDDAFIGRVTAIGGANRMAIFEAEEGLQLSALIRDALEVLPDGAASTIEAPDLTVGAEAVLPLSLVFYELATNGVKYGGLGDGGQLNVSATVDEDARAVSILWEERRPETTARRGTGAAKEGFGSTLVRSMVERRLAGAMTREVSEAGFRCEMTIPLAQIGKGSEF